VVAPSGAASATTGSGAEVAVEAIVAVLSWRRDGASALANRTDASHRGGQQN